MLKNWNRGTISLGVALFASLALSACGGGGGSGSEPALGGGSGSGGGTGAASLCSGASWLSPNYDVYANGSSSSTTQAATYYGANMSASSQCISIANTLQITTTDAFADVSWYDASGNGLSGGAADKFTENVLLRCSTGTSATAHLAVRSSDGATVLAAAQAPVLVGNGFTFQSEECNSDGSGVDVGLTTLKFGLDKSVSIVDTTHGGSTTSFTAAQVQQAFSSTGLTLGDGTVIRWRLYLEPVGALTKQVIVHTGTKTDGSVSVLAFLQS